jgi:hypothetical protein
MRSIYNICTVHLPFNLLNLNPCPLNPYSINPYPSTLPPSSFHLGKPLIKAGSSDEKHVQYMYCTLGTPRAVGYGGFKDLPLSNSFGGHIQTDEGTQKDSRSRLYKMLCAISPVHVHTELSECYAVRGNEIDKKSSTNNEKNREYKDKKEEHKRRKEQKVCTHVYIYVHIYIYICICIYI